jgi:tetratricopeptide (TPR) repeat protein
MYTYKEKRAISIGSFFFMLLFIFIFIGAGVLLYVDKGIFWDWLPIACIASAIINLILLIVYFVKKSVAGYIFTLFFIIFLAGVVLSSLFGPFAINIRARDAYEEKKYGEAAEWFKTILEEYPSSRYARGIIKDIAYTYYLQGSYEQSLPYFNDAIEQGMLDPEELENAKLFTELYSKLGDKYYSEKKLKAASDNYLKAVDYYDFISNKFPETNEAFIAKYKIPEYLYRAASGYAEEKMWDDTLVILEKLTQDYSQSEYYDDANNMLFNLYIAKAFDLKKSGNYSDGISSILSILDFPEEILKDKAKTLKSRSDSLFSGIDASVLISAADSFYIKSGYNKAIFLYDYILDNHTESLEIITRNFVDCKIKVNSNLTYEQILQNDPYSRIKKEGYSIVSFENKTDYKLTVYIAGPQYIILPVLEQAKFEINLPAGDYTVTAELSSPETVPFFGKVTYEDGGRYREIYQPAQEEIQE